MQHNFTKIKYVKFGYFWQYFQYTFCHRESAVCELGSGSVSEVWKIKTRNEELKFAVLKIAEIGLNYETMLNEIDILKQVDHENVVKYLDSFSLGRGNPCLVLEFCEQGSLQNFIVCRTISVRLWNFNDGGS